MAPEDDEATEHRQAAEGHTDTTDRCTEDQDHQAQALHQGGDLEDRRRCSEEIGAVIDDVPIALQDLGRHVSRRSARIGLIRRR